MTSYLPLSHPSIAGLTRVPLYRDPPLYTITLDTDYRRVFTEQSLPEFIRTRIVIADAAYEPDDVSKKIIPTIHDLFIYSGIYNLGDVGWKYNSNYYIVVLNKDEYNSLQGKDKEDGNT